MNVFEAVEREMRVDLRGGDVGVAKQKLDAAQIGAVFDHVGGATVSQLVRAGRGAGGFDNVPDPLAGERHAAQGEEEGGDEEDEDDIEDDKEENEDE